MNVIIFEGVSGAGKTTLIDAYNKATNYRDMCIHRFAASQWAYAKLNDREQDVDVLKRLERGLSAATRVMYIFLRVKPEIALARKQRSDDDNVVEGSVGGFKEIQQRFLDYFVYHTTLDWSAIDTDHKSIAECIQEIQEELLR